MNKTGLIDRTMGSFCKGRRLTVLITVFASLLLGSHSLDAQEGDKTTFDNHVKAIFAQRCASCHNPNKKSADLDVTNYTNLMQGGGSGEVIEPGDPDFSYLFSLVTHAEEPKMPPGGKIPDGEIEIIRKWIVGGALENMTSKAVIKKKNIVAEAGNPLERPASVAVPPRLSLAPQIHTARNAIVPSIATSPWAPIAAIAGQQQVILYNTQTLQLVGILPFPEGTVNVIRFSRNGTILMAAGGKHSASGVAVLWDVATGERVSEIGGDFDTVLAADISADHKFVALGGPTRIVKVYSTETGAVVYEITKPTDWVTSLAFSPDGVLLATGDRAGGLHVWEAANGREYLTLNGHGGSIDAMSWRLDSNVLASGSRDTTIRLWEMENGGQIRNWGAHGGGVMETEFTRDGRILSTGNDGVAKLWDINGAQQIAFPKMPEVGISTSWCDETARAIAGDFNGNVHVWDSSNSAVLTVANNNPIPLANRLADAQARLKAESEKLAPQKTQLDQLVAQVTQVEQELTTAQATQKQINETMVQVQGKIEATSAEMNQYNEQLNKVNTELTQNQQAKPHVAEATRNMVEAAQKLPTNQELQQQADALAAKVKQIDESIAALQASQADLQNKVADAKKRNGDVTVEMQQKQKELATVNTTVEQTQAKMTPMVEQRTALQATVDQLTAAVNQAQADTNRWQAEIVFDQQLRELREKLFAAQNVVVEKQQVLDQSNAKLSTVQQEVSQASEQVQAAQSNVSAIETEILKAKGIDQ